MAMVPYKQTLTHSCLAACFLMLQEQEKFTEADEHELALQGSRRTYPFYVVGIPMEFTKKFNRKLTVYVDNKYFASTLQKAFLSDKRINIIQEQITQPLIKALLEKKSVICHIDDHVLGDYSHASHFVVLEKATEKSISIIDPWSGERKKISSNTLQQAIEDLKTQVKMCPLIYSLEG